MGKRRRIKVKKPIGVRLCNIFKKIDMYGKSIVLHYKGEETFNTHIGGVASFLIFGVICAYFVWQFKIMLFREDSNVSKNTFRKELSEETSVHNIGEAGLVFGISLLDDDRNQLLEDPSYITYTVKQVSQVYVQADDGSTYPSRTKTDIPMSKCDDRFSHVPQEIVDRLGANNFYCPTKIDYTVAANFYAERFDYLELKFYKCNSATSTCASDIDEILEESQLQLTIQNAYFDIENYEEPVQFFLDDQYFWDILPHFRKKSDLYVREGQGETQDNYIQLADSEEHSFFSIANSRDQLVVIDAEDGEFMSVFFRLDATTESYERRIYSASDMLAQVGGLYQSIFVIGILLVGIFSERLFVSSILRKLYQIDEIREDHIKHEANERKQLKPSGTRTEINLEQDEGESNQDNSVHLSKMIDDGEFDEKEEKTTKIAFVKTVDMLESKGKDEHLEEDRKRRVFEFVKFLIERRSLFQYSYKDIIQYLLCCVCCRRSIKIRRNPKFRKHAFYDAGEEKLQDELDVVSVIKTIRAFALINRILFTREQRLLLKFQNKDIMRSTSEDSDDGAGYQNIVYNLHSKNKEIKRRFNTRMRELLEKYQRKPLEKIDKKIIKGLVQKEFAIDDAFYNEDELGDLSNGKIVSHDMIYKTTDMNLNDHSQAYNADEMHESSKKNETQPDIRGSLSIKKIHRNPFNREKKYEVKSESNIDEEEIDYQNINASITDREYQIQKMDTHSKLTKPQDSSNNTPEANPNSSSRLSHEII